MYLLDEPVALRYIYSSFTSMHIRAEPDELGVPDFSLFLNPETCCLSHGPPLDMKHQLYPDSSEGTEVWHSEQIPSLVLGNVSRKGWMILNCHVVQ